MMDSYKTESKAPYQDKAPSNTVNTVTDVESGSVDNKDVGETVRGLKPRHTQMIALGGAIGTGIFLGAGQNLARAGPAFLFLSYVVLGLLVLLVVTGITEVATYMPVKGGTMVYHGFRQVSSSVGFAMGWCYFYTLGALVPFEVVASALVIDYWGSPIPMVAWITIFIVLMLCLNLLPVKVSRIYQYQYRHEGETQALVCMISLTSD
jgi:yeast amino acid transporter